MGNHLNFMEKRNDVADGTSVTVSAEIFKKESIRHRKSDYNQ